MPVYIIEFTARLKNAIGVTYRQPEARVEAPNPDAAILMLYDTYEQVRVKAIREE